MDATPGEVRRRFETAYTAKNSPEEQQVFTNRVTRVDVDLGNRALPERSISDANLDDSYVAFILYCNPRISLQADTTELRKVFRAPPKSDGKSFNTFKLYELICRLESKELKTWSQLAVELGVEPPALDKGQSAQKVQQYAVRLKRWMHAMHVDAFFEYLLGKPHTYWTQVPSINEIAPETGRDGVVPEEDLALRALLPETRPKRGRRKNEDREDSELGASPSQRPRLESPTLSEDFMIARTSVMTEHPSSVVTNLGFAQGFDDRAVPWSATEIRGDIGSFRWPPSESTPTPLTAYPQSAITPTTRHQMWSDTNAPDSALTPKTRSRRRHGPAVSSAWPSSSGNSSAKLRGRPPSNRSITDGPFSTFPANPGSKDTPHISLQNGNMTVTVDSSVSNHLSAVDKVPLNPVATTGRPDRLQLQVPLRQGGNVRLATPPLAPPVLLVNGGNANEHEHRNNINTQFTPLMEYFNTTTEHDASFQNFVSFAFRQSEDTDRTNMDALESHFICEILAAEWYDATGQTIERCTIDEADKICKQVITNLKAESSSTEAFLINLSALAGGPLMTRLRMSRLDQSSVSHYQCHWKMRFGSIQGDFTIRATVHRGDHPTNLPPGPEQTEESWKNRYLDLQQQIRERDAKVGNLKRGVRRTGCL